MKLKGKFFILISTLGLLCLANELYSKSSKILLTGKLNINIATAKELMMLPGLGQKKATDMIKLREDVKGFKKLHDILKVNGLGTKLFEKINPYIKLDGKSDLKMADNIS